MNGELAGGICSYCPHPLDLHVMLALHPDARQGGLMFCPECGCAATWCQQGWPRPAMPPPHVVEEYRAEALRLSAAGD